MGLGHVSARTLREAGQGDHVQGSQHRGAGAGPLDLIAVADRTDRRALLGILGERVAAEFMTRRGGVVVGSNVAVGRGEVDLLVRWADVHAAVEVKTLGPGALADDPGERITPAKLAQVRRLAGALAPTLGPMRVDFVGVVVGTGRVSVTWRANVA